MMRKRRTAHRFGDKRRTNDVLTEERVDFSGLMLSTAVLEGLQSAGFERPSPIQLKAIPLGRCGLDLIAQAKSGTGKTCVFSVIALENINLAIMSVQVLILAPTREIAVQIKDVICSIGRHVTGLDVHVFIGGMPFEEDKKCLKQCHIAIGTPGRVKHLIENKCLITDSIRLFILDEADKLLDESFQTQTNWIYSTLPVSKQMLALSATYTEELAEHLKKYMKDPTFVRLNATDASLQGIRHYRCPVPFHSLPHKVFQYKIDNLMLLLSKLPFHQCLIFSNYQVRARNLSEILAKNGWPSAYISGSQGQNERLKAMEKLKEFKCRILISTDLTSRGIDAERVNLVVNMDVARDSETYLHRVGRAGRFGSYGAAVNFVSEGKEIVSLEEVAAGCGLVMNSLPDDLSQLLAEPRDDNVTTIGPFLKPEPSICEITNNITKPVDTKLSCGLFEEKPMNEECAKKFENDIDNGQGKTFESRNGDSGGIGIKNLGNELDKTAESKENNSAEDVKKILISSDKPTSCNVAEQKYLQEEPLHAGLETFAEQINNEKKVRNISDKQINDNVAEQKHDKVENYSCIDTPKYALSKTVPEVEKKSIVFRRNVADMPSLDEPTIALPIHQINFKDFGYECDSFRSLHRQESRSQEETGSVISGTGEHISEEPRSEDSYFEESISGSSRGEESGTESCVSDESGSDNCEDEESIDNGCGREETGENIFDVKESNVTSCGSEELNNSCREDFACSGGNEKDESRECECSGNHVTSDEDVLDIPGSEDESLVCECSGNPVASDESRECSGNPVTSDEDVLDIPGSEDESPVCDEDIRGSEDEFNVSLERYIEGEMREKHDKTKLKALSETNHDPLSTTSSPYDEPFCENCVLHGSVSQNNVAGYLSSLPASWEEYWYNEYDRQTNMISAYTKLYMNTLHRNEVPCMTSYCMTSSGPHVTSGRP